MSPFSPFTPLAVAGRCSSPSNVNLKNTYQEFSNHVSNTQLVRLIVMVWILNINVHVLADVQVLKADIYS